MGISAYNRGLVRFQENEKEYVTPYGTKVEAGSSFGFGQSVEFSDLLGFGYSGIVDLDADSTEFERRLSSAAVYFDYRPECWSVQLKVEELRDKTTTSSGDELEYVDRSLLLRIKLGGFDLPEQPLQKMFR